MTYSTKLQRHIEVPLEFSNHFDVAELRAATARFYDTPPDEIRRLAAAGDIDACYIVNTASGSGELAVECRLFLGQ